MGAQASPVPRWAEGRDGSTHLAHKRSQPGVGRALVRAEPELRIVIRRHRKLEVPCGEQRSRSLQRDTAAPAPWAQLRRLAVRWGSRDGWMEATGPPQTPCPGSVLAGTGASPPFEPGKRVFAAERPSWLGARGLSLRAFLSSSGPSRGKEAASPCCCRGRRGQALSLTILERVDVAKNPQPVVLPLGRHGQLLHCGAGLRRRDGDVKAQTARAQAHALLQHHSGHLLLIIPRPRVPGTSGDVEVPSPPTSPSIPALLGVPCPEPNLKVCKQRPGGPSPQPVEMQQHPERDEWTLPPTRRHWAQDSRGERAENGGSSSGASRPRHTSLRRRASLPSLCTGGQEREMSGLSSSGAPSPAKDSARAGWKAGVKPWGCH